MGVYNRNRKSASKQPITVLIKICFAFTGYSRTTQQRPPWGEKKVANVETSPL